MKKFWKFTNRALANVAGETRQVSVLRIDGPIDSEIWWGDEITPDAFRAELEACTGDIEVYINSPGGDVIAASQIYTMLVEHKGNVTVKIEGLAASAASIIAMAGTTVLMAPVAYMMIHGASTITWGNQNDLRHEADVLAEIDKGIRDAYRLKTGLRESRIAQMMEDETWMSAKTCIELGFADGYIGAEIPEPDDPDEDDDSDEDDDPDDKQGLSLVAWTGRKQYAALLRAVSAGHADQIERMRALTETTAEPEPEPEHESEPVLEEPQEPAPEAVSEPEAEPEPEAAPVEEPVAVSVQQFYDRLKTIKDKF